MEIDVKEHANKLRAEVAQMSQQLQQIDTQIAQLQQAKNNQLAELLKRQGALELVQSLEKKPKEDKKE